MIYFDFGTEYLYPDIRKSLEKRCTVIKTRFGEENRIQIDELELLNALSLKPKMPNMEYYENFLAPKNVDKLQGHEK